MSNTINNKNDLEAIIYRYLREITIANNSFAVYKVISEARENLGDEISYAPAFFNITERSNQYTFVMITAKLFDSNKQSTGLNKLIAICEQNKDVFPQEVSLYFIDADSGEGQEVSVSHENTKHLDEAIEEQKNILASYECKSQKLRDWRDNYFAHNDKKYFNNLNALAEKSPISDSEIEDMLKCASDICNAFLGKLTGTNFDTHSPDSKDLINLLAAFRTSRRKQETTTP